MADDAGITILSSHVNPPVREYTKDNLNTIKEYWKKTADDHAKLGVKYLVQPGQPSTRNVEETKFVCEVFNEAGKIVKAAGIPFGYHNHDMEFAKVVPGGTEMKFGRHNKGEKVYDIFLANTDPSLVFFEMDVYWAVMGQQDPVEYITKYADRIKAVSYTHLDVYKRQGVYCHQYHRSQYPVRSRRRSEKDLQRYEFQSRTQPCIRTCRTPCRESRRDDGRPVEETERRRRERRRR